MRALLSIALVLLCGTQSLHAQEQLAVAASVPVASPTGAGTRNLSFGSVMPGSAPVAVTVAAAAVPVSATVHSGAYAFNVASSRGLTFSMSTPTQLASPTLPGLPVSFNGTQYGAWCVTAGTAACTTTSFNPATATGINVCAQTLGNGNCHPNKVFPAGSSLAVYVGGALTVPPGTRAATYTATVTLTITQVY